MEKSITLTLTIPKEAMQYLQLLQMQVGADSIEDALMGALARDKYINDCISKGDRFFAESLWGKKRRIDLALTREDYEAASKHKHK
ncbi:MAG TPA: hypothetical protein VM577_04975 [Anaerovoracaceae bacterium]|nr:hypothetical protein [Anaerovoracaceae bacterium]